MNTRFITATPADQDALHDLALRSKASWGYAPSFIAVCREDLRVRESLLKRGWVLKAMQGEDLVGFLAFEETARGPELGYFFVDPRLLGKGLGTQLWDQALEMARAQGWEEFHIVSDPNAVPFYLKRGAQAVGEVVSELFPGRKLPLLRVSGFF